MAKISTFIVVHKLGRGTEGPTRAFWTCDAGIKGAAERPRGGFMTGNPMQGWKFTRKRSSLRGEAGVRGVGLATLGFWWRTAHRTPFGGNLLIL